MAIKNYASNILTLDKADIKKKQSDFLEEISTSNIAIHTQKANEQHYELPNDFFELILGKHMKYSGSIWNDKTANIESADSLTLQKYITRSKIHDNQNILELGSGWGSLSLHIAENFRESNITTVTNSLSQKLFIESKISSRKIRNLRVVKEDVSQFKPMEKFDRILSIEMLEHTRNTKALLDKINSWLNQDGLLFIQVFSHINFPQLFDDVNDSWMSKNFFSGGMMPYINFYDDIKGTLELSKSWQESGLHYKKTLDFWLKNLDFHQIPIEKILDNQINNIKSHVLINRFRIFLITCSELFGYNDGNDWVVMNHLMSKGK
jgi:cyclopropane-fatty-acyl-phospholipid synthase